MKKIVTLALALVMLLTAALPVFAADTDKVEASVFTENYDLQDAYYDYYSNLYDLKATDFDVYTADGLFVLIGIVNAKKDGFKGKTIHLKADLVFNEGNAGKWLNAKPEYEWQGFEEFRGTFDGEGHTISGIYLKSNDIYRGIFNIVKPGATIKNFRVTNSLFWSPDGDYTASIIGRINNDPSWKEGKCNITISNIYTNATVKGKLHAGGIVGLITNTDETLSISNCVNDGVVSADYMAGGIVGKGGTYQHSDGGIHPIHLTDCVNLGTVSAGTLGGAITGEVSKVYLTRCANFGTVTSEKTGAIQNTMVAKVDGTKGSDLSQPKVEGKYPAWNTAATQIAEFKDCYNISENTITEEGDMAAFAATASVTQVAENDVKGAAASATLAKFDFTNTWATVDGAFPMPKTVAGFMAGVANEKEVNVDIDSILGIEADAEEEEEEEETKKTNKKKDTEAVTEAETTAEDEKKGCGSSIGIASLAVLAVAGGVTFVATKKKED